MKNDSVSTIVIGSVSTDIIASGVKKIAGIGESVRGKELIIGPGGKAVNVSRMIAALSVGKKVSIIGKTSTDPFNLWKVPLDALTKSGVNTDYIQIVPYDQSKKYPTIALVPVDVKGNNQVYGLRGIGEDFNKKDIDNAVEIFKAVGLNNGILIFSFQIPVTLASYAMRLSKKYGIKVFLDPGGIQADIDYTELLNEDIYLLKPNEHETKMLTGITVSDFSSAQKAAKILLQKNIQNVLITHGMHGGYLFNKNTQVHIPAPHIELASEKDETGCGDQTIATISALLTEGKDIVTAVKMGILAGTLQFTKLGIVPVTKSELHDASKFV
jgi:ribokinase